jgi:AcrR family transcriptional regulator
MTGMAVPYEQGGRQQQKARTREALVAATRRLLADGHDPTVDEVATAAGISRTTAYRYFPNQRSLLLASHPETQQQSLLPENAPSDPQARLDLVMKAFLRITLEWEPQLRMSLRLSLQAPTQPATERPALRQGRAIGWLEDALEPLRHTHPSVDVHRLALALRSATGIESLIWLTDIAGLTRKDAAKLMHWSARAMLQAALTGPTP